jgi:MFS family permease
MIYFLAMAVAGVAVALAPNVWLLFVGLTTLGLAASIYHPTGLAMLSLGVRREARGRAMGINGVAGSIGVATGPTLGMLAASLGWGMWRLAYVAVAVLALIAAGLMWLASRKPSCGAAKGSGVFFRKVDVCSSESPLVPKKDFRPLLSLASLAFLFAAMTFGGFNYRCLVTGLPALLSGESAAAGQLILGGLMTFIALVAGGIGQYGGGWLADRFGSRRIYVMLIGMLVLLAMLLGTLDGSALALPVACLLAVSLFGQQPVENSLLAECTSAGRRGASYGVKFALTFGLGALGAYVAGLVWHHFEAVGPVFYLLAGSATMMGLLALGYLALAGVGSSDDLRAGRVSDGHASVAYASGSEPNPSALESPS